MSLLSDLKFVIKKYLKNPILVAAVAYTMYMLLTKYSKKEAFAESIKVIEKKGNISIIYDDKLKKYILVDHEGKGVYSANSLDKLKGML